ncbi:hypothetical protein GCM10009804_08120 [Kribbella hippodromi]|uniref:DUF2332 family protein n=1 Tax=Kribbella hippodromi TaxID=434347 RepID=A0ABP4N1N0_9ACTN
MPTDKGRARPASPAANLAETYRRFSRAAATKSSPFYQALATALSTSPEALTALNALPSDAHPEHASANELASASRDPQQQEQPSANDPASAGERASARELGSPGSRISAGAAGAAGAADVEGAAGAGAAGVLGLSLRQPAGVLAGLHELVLSGRAPRLAAAYAALDVDAAVTAAIEVLTNMPGAVAEIAARRQVRSFEPGRHAVLYPAITEAAHRVGASRIALIDAGTARSARDLGTAGDVGTARDARTARDVGTARGVGAGGGVGRTLALHSTIFNLNVDRAGVTYNTGQSLGDPASPVQQSARVVGKTALPTHPMPEVVARISVASVPIDLTDPAEARWLHACLPPDQQAQSAALDAELALAAASPPRFVPGELVDGLSDALAQVPLDVLPVVLTTWTLSGLSLEDRLRFLQRLDAAATERPVAWVSVEGVGVAPAIPTFGDRPASGHSIIDIAIFDHSSLQAESVGRTWSRGAILSWLAQS